MQLLEPARVVAREEAFGGEEALVEAHLVARAEALEAAIERRAIEGARGCDDAQMPALAQAAHRSETHRRVGHARESRAPAAEVKRAPRARARFDAGCSRGRSTG